MTRQQLQEEGKKAAEEGKGPWDEVAEKEMEREVSGSSEWAMDENEKENVLDVIYDGQE